MKTDVLKSDVSIDWMHHLVHDEKVFSLSMSDTIDGAETLAMHVSVAAGKQVHFDMICTANKAGVLVMTEGDTLAGGTAQTPVNNNRTSSKTMSSTLTKDSTISAAGTTIRTIVVGAGIPVKVGGEGRTNLEFILKPSTKYSFVFTADGASTVVSLNADMYEA